MTDWLMQTASNMTWRDAIIGLVLFVVTFTGSIGLVSFMLVRIPANYFHSEHDRALWTDRHRAVRWSGMIMKNVIGVVLIVLGIVMSLPGVPGQGILTILLGLMLVDLPGKRRWELKLVSRPKVLQTINQLRGKFGKPPLVLD
nr:sodium:dicarboxylate symporter family [uncultured bacterium]